MPVTKLRKSKPAGKSSGKKPAPPVTPSHHVHPGAVKHAELPKALRAYAFHGLAFRKIDPAGESRTSCIYCEDETHFFINNETGQFHCKKCGTAGNQYTWLADRHEVAFQATDEKDWQELSKLRGGFDPWAYNAAGVACEINASGNAEWLVPVYARTDKSEKSLVNIRVWGGPGSEFVATDNCALHLWNGHKLDALTAEQRKTWTVIVCEGEWDGIALESVIDEICEDESTPKDSPYRTMLVVATPGCSVFKDEWAEKFKGCKTVLMYDNDGPGQEGQIRAATKLAAHVSHLSVLRWLPDVNDGYDVSDFLRHRIWPEINAAGKEQDSPPLHVVLNDLFALCGPPTDADGKPLAAGVSLPENKPPRPKVFKKPPTFKQVIAEYRKVLHTDRDMDEAIAIMYAVILSNRIPGDPLWLFVVGPPGSGKTLMLMTFRGVAECAFRSMISAQSLISGYKTYPGEEDPSDLPKIVGKTLILKDFTEVMSMSGFAQEELFGILRGAYDGSASRPFGNRESRVYDETTLGRPCHFSMLAGVTQAIHSHQRATLGERFLKLTFIRPENHDPQAHILAALSTSSSELVDKCDRLTSVACEYLEQSLDTLNTDKLPGIDAKYIHRLSYLAQVIAYLRAGVERSHTGELAYKPQAEVGTRIAKQLRKLMQALCWVYGKTKVDDDIYRIAERVAFDTAVGWNLDVVAALANNYPSARLVADLVADCRIGPANLRGRLNNMIELGMVEVKKLGGDGPKRAGQPALGYQLSAEFMHLWTGAAIMQKFSKPVNALRKLYEKSGTKPSARSLSGPRALPGKRKAASPSIPGKRKLPTKRTPVKPAKPLPSRKPKPKTALKPRFKKGAR